MSNDFHFPYPFSFQLKLCQDIRYYKKTTIGNGLNVIVENFILNFFNNNNNNNNYKRSINKPKRGRPCKNQELKNIDKYTPLSFSLKKSTINKIKQHKKKRNTLNINTRLEEYLRLIVPVREIR